LPLEEDMSSVVLVSAFKEQAIDSFSQQFIPEPLHEGRANACSPGPGIYYDIVEKGMGSLVRKTE